MKKIVLILTLTFSYVVGSAQCTPLPYQDSLYGIWPDTVQNLPTVIQGVSYSTTLTVKTPLTLLEAASGDSTLTVIDTVLLGTAYTFQIGDWPVDSMKLIQVNGLPNGLTLNCDDIDPNVNNCMLPGDYLTCASVDGLTNDPIGVYAIVLLINIHTHGVLDLGFIQYPLQTDLYSALGSYEEITGYNIVVNSTAGIQTFHQDDFVLFQNAPNPFTEFTNIQFNSPKSDNVAFEVVDMFGRSVYTERIAATKGVNTYQFSHDLSAGIYMYTINNGKESISKRMIVAEK